MASRSATLARRATYWAKQAAQQVQLVSLEEQNAEELLARDDFGFFCGYVAGKVPATHHRAWIDKLITGIDSDCLNRIAGNNLEILAPRGAAKSTVMALFCAWSIGHNPNAPIIYVSYSESVALSRSRIVKRIIESDRYRKVFPWIEPGRRWADTDWEINKTHAEVTDLDYDYTFYATGVLGSITSRRSALIIYDDLIKSSDSISNPEIREKMITNIAEVLRPTLIPGGREIDIGTRFRPDDIHATEFTEEKGWEVIVQSAITEDQEGVEHSYWPERFSVESLKFMRDDKPGIFSFQYQNVIVRISEISIDPDWIVRDDIPKEFDTVVVGADLSSGQQEKSDYTVFILLGKNRHDERYYVIDMRRGRWTGNVSKLRVLMDMLVDYGFLDMQENEDNPDDHFYYSGYQTVYFVAEGVSYQSSMQGDFREFVVKKHNVTNVVYKKPKIFGDKLSRLRGVSGLFENKLVVFNKNIQFNRAIKELTNFGSLDHDDCVDAIVHGLRSITGRRAIDMSDSEGDTAA